jgi:hypothetical protein
VQRKDGSVTILTIYTIGWMGGMLNVEDWQGNQVLAIGEEVCLRIDLRAAIIAGVPRVTASM